MAKTTTVQRKRRQQSLASMLYDPYIAGCFKDYRGNPAKAPKRWKRQWVRQWKFVLKARPAIRHNARIKLLRAAQQAANQKYALA